MYHFSPAAIRLQVFVSYIIDLNWWPDHRALLAHVNKLGKMLSPASTQRRLREVNPAVLHLKQ